MTFTGAGFGGDPWGAMEQVRSQRDRNYENRARYAEAMGFELTTGYGETKFPDVIPFKLAFVTEPAVAYGCALDDDTLVSGRFPRCHGGVYTWQLDAKGFYIGAWVFVAIDTISPQLVPKESEPNYKIRHSFRFFGPAYKSLPDFIANDL